MREFLGSLLDPRNKPGEGLDSAAGDGPALPVDPLSLSSLLSQGFDEGPARQALRKFKNDTQAALDFLIGGGHAEEEQEEAVRMPTTVRRVQRLKERRRAQQARRKEEEERRQKDLAREETPPKEPQESPKTSPKAAPKPAVDLLDFEGEKKKPSCPLRAVAICWISWHQVQVLQIAVATTCWTWQGSMSRRHPQISPNRLRLCRCLSRLPWTSPSVRRVPLARAI